MESEVSWLLELDVKPGELDNLRSLMSEMVAHTRTEPGVLVSEWFVSGDGEKVVIYERYVDSVATRSHIAAFGEQFVERFLECVTPIELQVLGSPSDAVRAGLDGFGAAYFGPFGGFARSSGSLA